MQSAVRTTIATFGVINAIAGFEHGLGEVLQGSVDPQSVFILSWPESAFFAIHGGEPAMTLIPNLLVSGILSILVSLAFAACATVYAGRRHAGLVLILLSVLWLLVGGGFGPPLLGIILGAALSLSRRAAVPGARPVGWRGTLGRQWPWLFAAAVAAWLLVFPGVNLLDFAFHLPLADAFVYGVIFSALTLLLLALWAGPARDQTHRQRA